MYKDNNFFTESRKNITTRPLNAKTIPNVRVVIAHTLSYQNSF